MNPYLFVLALLAGTLFSEGFSLATAADHDPKNPVREAERPNVLLIQAVCAPS